MSCDYVNVSGLLVCVTSVCPLCQCLCQSVTLLMFDLCLCPCYQYRLRVAAHAGNMAGTEKRPYWYFLISDTGIMSFAPVIPEARQAGFSRNSLSPSLSLSLTHTHTHTHTHTFSFFSVSKNKQTKPKRTGPPQVRISVKFSEAL